MLAMNTRHALIGSVVAAIVIGAYDQYRIEQLEHQIAMDQAQMRLMAAGNPAPLPSRTAPNVQQALAERELLWSQTFGHSEACRTATDSQLRESCAKAYMEAREQFFTEHPLTQFMDAQQR